MPTDAAAVLRALGAANVQFVVVGDPEDGSGILRLVVSRHPTNLEAMGRVLDRLGATLGTRLEAGGTGGDEASRRVVDPLGTLSVTAGDVGLQLLFGGPRRSLYAESVALAEPKEVHGVTVQWTREAPLPEPAPRVTSRTIGKRLLSLAEGLAHLMERNDVDRHDDPPPEVHET